MASRSDKRRVLLTGASGFTGRYVADALGAAGHEVHALVSGGRNVDLTDRRAVANAIAAVAPDQVIHLAAIAFVAHGDVDEMYRVNVLGTRNLLAALSELPTTPSHVVLASSANIYGNTPGVIGEHTDPAPQNDYAVSKLAMEHAARLWTDKLPITIVRPFNYTGVGQSEKFLIPKIVSHFQRAERVIELGNLDVSRDFNDVRAVADAYVRILESGDAVGTFNVCSGEAHTLRSVVELMSGISGRQVDLCVNPAFVRANEVRHLVGTNQRYIERFGATRVIALEETLRWMYEAR